MIEVEQHAPSKRYRTRCQCGCIFTFDNTDIRSYDSIEFVNRMPLKAVVRTITCPECGDMLSNKCYNFEPLNVNNLPNGGTDVRNR